MNEPVPSPLAPESNAGPPTIRDCENARIREEIAARQAREYGQVLAWAQAAFGEGWLPSHRHFLLLGPELEVFRLREQPVFRKDCPNPFNKFRSERIFQRDHGKNPKNQNLNPKETSIIK